MPIKINYDAAQQVLLEALELARSDARLPVIWKSHSRAVFGLEAKTWTPAFATMLLAKATDDGIDTMSLKVEPSNPSSYSARGLCHKILVPAAVEHNFSIRNTGREPLNNQPFFRYDRIDEIDRVRNPEDREYFFDVAEQVNALATDEALKALAAFLHEAIAVNAEAQGVTVKTDGLTASGARIAVQDFLRADALDRPHRLQAFAAACLELLYDEVKTRRLNDPSRDFPGDVHAMMEGATAVAVEVRGKAVNASDLATFAKECERAGVRRAVMFVDSPDQKDLDAEQVMAAGGISTTQVAVYTSAARLLANVFIWAKEPLDDTIESFSEGFLDQLRHIEVTVPTLQEWTRAVAIARGR